jgi:asparagine synthase (glutamine-hydrolysing)
VCGICGFLGKFDRDLLARMSAILAHRGPDDGCLWYSGELGVGLAHRRLSIIDLSTNARQPMWDEAGELCIVFNGEIYNYRELRRELQAAGCHFRSQSDTEVLLQLYREDGAAMLPRLNGIFAFALYDARDGSLLLARDGLGVKPLYYTCTPRGVLFASEIKALLQEREISRELDPVAIQSYLAYLWSPGSRTPLAAVHKLEPGYALAVARDGIQKRWCFYDLPYDQPPRTIAPGEAAEELRALLRQAVRRQMVADVPVGSFLSGGLDSSSVVAYAREFCGGEPLRCFTIGAGSESMAREGMADDLPYAKSVAKHLGVRLDVVYVGSEMADELEGMIYHLDEPQADPAPINVLLISRLARQHGIKVLLSGGGGDDIFTGYRRHVALMRERYWSWLPRPLRRGLAAMAGAIPVGTAAGRRLSKAFRYAALDGDERLVSYFYWCPPEIISAICAPIQGNALPPVGSALLDTLHRLPQGTHRLQRMLYLEGKHFLADHNLNYTDKAAMAAGVEVRVPLLDPDLVAFAASLPPHLKQHGSTGKWIFKKAMEPMLPRSVIYRPKTGFGAPLREWLRGPLRPVVEDLLSEARLRRRGLFDPAAVAALVHHDAQGRLDGTYTIFALMCMEMWAGRFVDSVPQPPPVPEPVELQRPLAAGAGDHRVS